MKKIQILLIIFTTILLFTSCDDLFYVDDRERIDEEIVVSKNADVSAMWAYLYHGFTNGFQHVNQAMLANACDEADLNQPFHSVQIFNDGSWNSINNPENYYYTFYNQIRNACKFLQVTDTANNSRFTYEEYRLADPPLYHRYRREMKAYRIDASFFKGYYHFELWKRYKNIPIINKVMTEEDAKTLKQNSSEEIIDYIIDLLDDVIAQFDELSLMEGVEYVNNKWSDQHYGRITKGIALALKTRVLLYAASPLNTSTGVYDKQLCEAAAKAAAELINLNIYSTNITYRELQFNKNSNNPENILDARVNTTGTVNYMELWNYPQGGAERYVTPSVGSNATCPSQNLVDAYETIDGSPVDENNPYINRDPRLKHSILCNGDIFNGEAVQSYVNGLAGIGKRNCTTTGYYLKKFVQNEIRLPNGENTSHIWYVFRYSEILLNYAEAMFYAFGPDVKKGYITSGDDLSAIDALNRIRNRADVGMPSIINLTEEKLRNERRIELAFEGHRFWDVRRWKIAEQTENISLMGMEITKNGDTYVYDKVEIEPRVFQSKMYHFPIPYNEMNNYPNWNQNEGWSF